MANYPFDKYSVLFYGSSAGYNNFRAQIQLFNAATPVGYVRFVVSGAAFPADTESGGVVTMHMPESSYASVIDLLRNEKPLLIYYVGGRAFLGTVSTENTGEDDV